MTNTDAIILITETTVSVGAVGYLGWRCFGLLHENRRLSKAFNDYKERSEGYQETMSCIHRERELRNNRELHKARLACEKLNKENKFLNERNSQLKTALNDSRICYDSFHDIINAIVRVEESIPSKKKKNG